MEFNPLPGYPEETTLEIGLSNGGLLIRIPAHCVRFRKTQLTTFFQRTFSVAAWNKLLLWQNYQRDALS